MLDELPPFDYLDAATLAEAVAALTEHGPRAQVLAGGTDLLGLMKDRISGPGMPVPEVLVNVKRIPELHGIAEAAAGGLRIGAAVTLADLERDARVMARFPALAQAAAAVATTQIRAMGTVGGNLCQRPWCWYFRHPQFPCLKRGGNQCFALPGSNRTYFGVLGLGVCVMSHPSDLAPALIALDARVAIAGPAGPRAVPIEQFFRGPRSRTETVLEPGEILVAVDVPAPAPGARSFFLKHRLRGTWDFALSEVAVSATPRSAAAGGSGAAGSGAGRWENVRVALGGVAPFPFRATAAEAILAGHAPSESLLREAAQAAVGKARPLTQNGYKIDLTRALVARALSALAADLG
jgi:xanthine dehydrogenase YagS FAD-binding subunit